MRSRDLKSLLSRVTAWPVNAQDEAAKALREIEEDYVFGRQTQHDVDIAHDHASRGEGIALGDLKEKLGLDY